MIKLLLRAWELATWIQAFQYFVSILLARVLGRPDPPPWPVQLASIPSYSPGIDRSPCLSPKLAFVHFLEGNWSLILLELQQLNIATAWMDEGADPSVDWSMFELYTQGIKLEKNCRLCPETSQLVERIPNLIAAGFFALAPGKHVCFPQKQPDSILCGHLGLVIPDCCGIRLGGVSHTWREGKCLIFRKPVDYEMWNWSNTPHIVLVLDLKVSDDLILE